ncbi:hypothetical protein GCM10027036_03180 [Flavihumibacter cheonanensis]|uniref:hypothetical protein n=1 Tax=Flavihumibacter cheonanensis TaxID=1442385 RepID=UPI001EF82142|nr:hypothetical protein [Flavihumibacter cheonanensis]MCG7752237.1 hypothetical protein [Flavihumibacter cheonanensis]
MTKSEKFVSDLCSKSFLPFWSFPSPIGKKNNELCDLLVICDKHIIIISVKDIEPSKHEDETNVYTRWVKKAIHESVSQIYGAEKYINSVDTIQLKNADYTVDLPPKNKRIIYRIAIAFGSKPHFPLPTGHFGKGFVNVFDENSTMTILKELDTITDFTNYLVEKQSFSEKNTILVPFETDFLALYLETGLKFEIDENIVLGGENLWEEYVKSEKYLKWEREKEVSYVFDIMIQSFFLYNKDLYKTKENRNNLEKAIRIIALEPRINRIKLGLAIENAIKNNVKSRMLTPYGNAEHTYVFMRVTENNWESKDSELGLRCIVARAEFPQAKIIIGVSIYRTKEDVISFDFHYIHIPDLDDKFIKIANSIKSELGLFKNVKRTHSKEIRE